MPGEMVTLLLGAQGGDEESFACLYAVTNPVLVRYLRSVSDADPAPLALATWSTLLDGLSGCVVDDDDAWLELAVGTARQTALASAAHGSSAHGSSSPPAPDGHAAVPAHHGTGPEPDPVDAGVAMLRACGPAVADVLAMGVVAGLGRDSIARITGQQPTDVLALVHEGEDSLALPLDTLMARMQLPGSPAEVADLPAVRPLFAAQSHAALAAGAAGAASAAAAAAASTGPSRAPKTAAALLAAGAATAATAGTTAAATPAATTTAAGSTAAASAGDSGVVDLFTWGHPDPEKSSFVVPPSPQPSRWASIGASAAAWTIVVGGLGTAAAMSGVIPAAIDSIFGNDGNRPVVVAQGPTQPGETPSPDDGGTVTTPGPSDGQPGSQGPSEPGTGGGGTSTGGVVVVSAGFGTDSGAVVVPAVVTNPPSTPSTPPAPTTPGPGVQPPTTTPPPPTTGGGTDSGSGSVKGGGNAYAYGKGHAKHSTGNAKGRAKAPKAKPAAKSQAKSAAAKARAAAKAVKAAAKAAAARAKSGKSRA